jgi:hypothetical protein
MYDLEKDPHELKSMYADPAYADTVQQLKSRLSELRREYKDDSK